MKKRTIITLSVGHDRRRKGAYWGSHEFDVVQKVTAGVESKLKGLDPDLDVVRAPTPLRSGIYFARVNDNHHRDRIGPSFSTLPQKTAYINRVVASERSSGDPVEFLHVEFHLNAFLGNQIDGGQRAHGTEILLHGTDNTPDGRQIMAKARQAAEHFSSIIESRTGYRHRVRPLRARPDLWYLRKTLGVAWIWELWFIDDPEAMKDYEQHTNAYHETIAATLYRSTSRS